MSISIGYLQLIMIKLRRQIIPGYSPQDGKG